MADIQLTPAQEAAVTDQDGALLVSAAAGSGKTKVLVDRLMGQICDPVRPRNINDYLIITYTKAAASELRAKISAELGGIDFVHCCEICHVSQEYCGFYYIIYCKSSLGEDCFHISEGLLCLSLYTPVRKFSRFRI